MKASCTAEEIAVIKENLEDAIELNKNKLEFIIIESNLPKKTQYSNSNDGSFRGSKYRGPSKNRNKWQVMKMINKQTVRIGTVSTEIEAARIYDFLALLTEGINVSQIIHL